MCRVQYFSWDTSNTYTALWLKFEHIYKSEAEYDSAYSQFSKVSTDFNIVLVNI